jgi:hypothetical protein
MWVPPACHQDVGGWRVWLSSMSRCLVRRHAVRIGDEARRAAQASRAIRPQIMLFSTNQLLPRSRASHRPISEIIPMFTERDAGSGLDVNGSSEMCKQISAASVRTIRLQLLRAGAPG